MSVQWKFRVMSRGEINVDPIEGQFFTSDVIGSLSDALVREAIQNSLDAAIPGEQVRVIISFSKSNERLDGSRKALYFGGLATHLRSKNSGLIHQPHLTDPMGYIVLEDFGTRGLAGDTRKDEDSGDYREGMKNDFFYFWRNIGRAVEGTTARGRWGLGKTVFQATSQINSFFGLTIRRSDPRRLLMGQSVLKIHRVNGRKYAPYGYYGIFEDDFALPIESTRLVEQFCQDFTLQRRDEPGLSVVIPYPDEEIRPENIIRSSICHYFFPILAGDLVVIVRNGPSEELLDADSIYGIVTRTEWPDRDAIIRRLDLAKWCIELPEENYERLKEPTEDRAPKWDEKLFDQESLKRLQERFDGGKRVAMVAPLWVKRQDEDIQYSSFKVVLERDDEIDRGEDRFIRDGVTIAGVSSLNQRGIRVIVSVSDRPLSKLLGDSENPAHTEWQERSPKFRGRYERGASCLRFVKNSPREIVKILSRPAHSRDRALLRDLFYVDLPAHDERPGLKRESTGAAVPDGAEKPDSDVLTGDRVLQLQKTRGGFRLSGHPDAKILPKIITIEMAYDVRRGNPFKRYQPFDFELNKPPIRVRGKGVKAALPRPNTLNIFLKTRDFELIVTGFDPHRDLKIKTMTSLDAKR